MNRFGERLEESGCPEQLSDAALGHLLWKPSPFQQSGAQVQCTIDLPEACILDGVITVRSSSGLPENLQTCSETGRNRHQLKHSATLGQWLDAELDKQTVGFVLNLPESGDNVWHNLHWIVPATARLYGKAKTSLGVRAPRDVLLILLFDAYEFREDDQQANLTEVRCKCFRCNGTNWFFIIIIRFTMFLYVLGMWQQLLLDRNHSAQEKRAARRLPSFIRHCRSSTSSSGWLGTAFKGNSCLEAFFRYPFV
ncbi:unnamed protein product [Durusdinium trenchii]|uniref:Uncharacterized protein n=1 Tax=Durusdinium trenchii TaxID=1381693 RepID=A0ABP0JA13_9DINO